MIAADTPVVVRSCTDCPWWRPRWTPNLGRCGATGADTDTHDRVQRDGVRVLSGCPLLTGPIHVRLP